MAQRTETVTLTTLLDSSQVELHPITNDYPVMSKEETNRLYTDIVEAGEIRQPLLMFDDGNKKWIFDGRNRYNLLKDYAKHLKKALNKSADEFTIPVTIYTDINEGEMRRISDSFNLSRRHLTPQQKSIIAFSERLKDQREQIAEEIEKNTNAVSEGKQKAENKKTTIQSLAHVVGINTEYIQKWKNVYDFFSAHNEEEYSKAYLELMDIAYLSKPNFDKICALFRYPKQDGKPFEIQNSSGQVLAACKEMIEAAKDNLERKITTNVNEVKKENNLPVPVMQEETNDDINNPIKIFLNFRIEKSQMERIALVLRDELKKSGVKPPYEVGYLKRNSKSVISEVSDFLNNKKIEVYSVTDDEVLPRD